MKINFGTTSDVSNAKTGLKLDGKSDKDNGENESFFSKLASLFSGENDTKAHSSAAKNGASDKVESETKGETVAKSLANADNQGLETDEGLELVANSVNHAGDGEQVAELDSEALKTQTDAEASEKSLTKSDSTTVSSSTSNVSQVMDEGKQVLHRLQEANSTLSSGKALPLDDGALTAEMKMSAKTGTGEDNLLAQQQTLTSDIGSNALNEMKKQVSADTVKGKVNAQVAPDVKGNVTALAFEQTLPQMHQQPISDEPDSVELVDAAVLSDSSSENDAKGMVKRGAEDEVAQAALNDFMPSDYKLAATGPEAQNVMLSELANGEENGLATAAALSSPKQPKMTTDDGQFSLHQQTGQPIPEQAMMFAPGVIAGMMNESNPSSSMMYVDTDGQVIDIEKLNKAELEQLAHKHGKTVPQLLSSALPMSVNSQQQAHFVAMQSLDKHGAESLNLAANQVSNTAINNAAMSEAAALMSKDMAKAFEQKSGLNVDRHILDVRNMDGDGIGKDSHVAQQVSAMNSHNASSLPQIARLESTQASQSPVQVNKDTASEQLAERVNMMLSKNLKNIDIRLDPPDLGKVHIRMHINGDTTSVQFTVANHHAREALENSMPRLREMLSQQGVQVGDTAVQHQSAGQQQNGYAASGRSGQEQSGQSQNSNSATDSGFGEENNESDVTLRVNVPSPQDGISYYA